MIDRRESRRRSAVTVAPAVTVALTVAAVGLAAQLLLLGTGGTISGGRTAFVAALLGLALMVTRSLEPGWLRAELASLAAVAGLGGFGMLAGGLLGAGTAGMVVGCLAACWWLSRLQGLCRQDRDWRHHALGLLTMIGGMVVGAWLLTAVLRIVVADAAGHFAMVSGMAAGTLAGMWAVDKYDQCWRLKLPLKNTDLSNSSQI